MLKGKEKAVQTKEFRMKLKEEVWNTTKGTLKSMLLIFWFLFCQCGGSILLILYKVRTNPTWVVNVNRAMQQYGLLSKEYMGLISELIMPALILADILIAIPFIERAIRKKRKIYKSISKIEAVNIISLGILLNFLISFVVEILPKSATSESYDALMSIITEGNFYMVLLSSGILAPIIEEIVFRFGIMENFKNQGYKKAIIISALFFGIAHLNLVQGTYAFIMGIVLGYLYWDNGNTNLTKPTLLHIAINAGSVLYAYAPTYIQIVLVALVVPGSAIVLYLNRKTFVE